MILIYTICKNKNEAKKIAGMLVKLRLIACANFWPIESIYRWNGRIVNSKETALILKTRNNYYNKIESLIKKIHSDETPCILKIDISQVNRQYLDWLMKETRIV